ncbi:hypothetical protein ACJX0J_018697, partial [Zea mays]
ENTFMKTIANIKTHYICNITYYSTTAQCSHVHNISTPRTISFLLAIYSRPVCTKKSYIIPNVSHFVGRFIPKSDWHIIQS